MNIQHKILASMTSLATMAAIAVLVASGLALYRELDRAMHEKVDVGLHVVERAIVDLKNQSRLAALGAASHPGLAEAVENQDRDVVVGIMNALKNILHLDVGMVVDNEGTVIKRMHEPEQYGDNIRYLPHVESALLGNIETHITPGPFVPLSISTGAPLYGPYGNIMGAVTIGFRLDDQEFIRQLKLQTGCEISIFVGEKRIAVTHSNDDEAYLLGTNVADDIREKIQAGERYTGNVLYAGKTIIASYIPLHGANNEIVGIVGVGFDTTEDVNKLFPFLRNGIIVALLAIGTCIILAHFISKAFAHGVASMIDDVREESIHTRILLEHTQVLLDATPMCCTLWDRQLEMVNCNEEALKLFGVHNKAEFMKDFFDLAPERQPNGMRSREGGRAMIEKAFHEGYAHAEWIHQTPAGVLMPCEATFVRVQHRDRHLVAGFSRDLREQKAAIARIREADERMQLMLNAMPISCTLRDSGMDIIACNQATLDLYGLKDLQEFIEKFDELLPEVQPNGQNSVLTRRNYLEQALAEGTCLFEWMYRSLSGEDLPCEVTLVRLSHNDRPMMAIYVRDLREQKKYLAEIEKARLETEAVAARLEAVVAQYRGVIWGVDVDKIITIFRGQYLHTLGLTPAMLEGKNITLAREKNKHLDIVENVERILRDGVHLNWISDIDNRAFHSYASPLYNAEGNIIGVVGSTDDETEIHELQRELKNAFETAETANKAKSIFLANMSHEIRTPMNSIIGFAELARENNIAPQTKDYLDNILEGANWLLHIINDILDISKIESGKIALEHVSFDLYDMLEHCQSVILPKALEKGVRLYCYAEPTVEKKLLGDPIRLSQALVNLLSNAVKFTSIGTVKLMVSVKRSDDDSVTLCFEVKDSGIGITAEQIERIFEPFVQADSSVTRRFGGTGLGLPITKSIVELMGGTLIAESTPEQGSKFSFELTFKYAEDTDKGVSFRGNAISDIERPVFDGEILICEDNNMNQRVLCDHLAKVGVRTVVAQNGKEGIDILLQRMQNGEKLFDLILMDIHMPVMDGLEAASRIEELGVKIPIVAATANIMSNDLELYKTSGMCDCIGKPFTAQELWKCLLKYLPIVKRDTLDSDQLSAEEEKMRQQLRLYFVRQNQTTYAEINEAIDAKDFKLARRLSHTLKSTAGQIGAKRLSDAAAAAEAMFSGERSLLDTETLGMLEAELSQILHELAPLQMETEKQTEITDAEKVRAIIEKLEPMLMDRNPECVDLIGDLLKIPGSEELVQHMERFRFQQAIDELTKLKNEWK